MAFEYTSTQSWTQDAFEGEQDVVVQVELVCKNTTTGKSYPLPVALDMSGFDPTSGFTPYPDVTEAQLTGWAKSSLPDWMLTNMEAQVS